MPCDSVRQVSIILEKMDAATLKTGLDAEGLQHYTNSIGEIEIFSNREFLGAYHPTNKTFRAYLSTASEEGEEIIQERAKQVKRAYSAGVVVSQAKKFGWKLTRKTTPQGLTQYEVQK